MDATMSDYLNGRQEQATIDQFQELEKIQKRIIADDDDQESDSDSLDDFEENLIDFDSKVIQKAGVPYEPKLFVLYVNNKRTDYDTEFLDQYFEFNVEELDRPKSSAVRLLSEVLQFTQIHNYHQDMLSPGGIYLLDLES